MIFPLKTAVVADGDHFKLLSGPGAAESFVARCTGHGLGVSRSHLRGGRADFRACAWRLSSESSWSRSISGAWPGNEAGGRASRSSPLGIETGQVLRFSLGFAMLCMPSGLKPTGTGP